MNILVLYNSQRGHTHAAAKAIARTVDALSHQAVVKRIVDASPADVDAADALFIGTWVHGLILFGVEPAGAEQWVPDLPPLDAKPIGVFCTYAFHPRRSLQTLTDMLAERGSSGGANRPPAAHARGSAEANGMKQSEAWFSEGPA